MAHALSNAGYLKLQTHTQNMQYLLLLRRQQRLSETRFNITYTAFTFNLSQEDAVVNNHCKDGCIG